MHTKKSSLSPIEVTGFIVTSVLAVAWMVGAFLTPTPVSAAGDAGLALDFDGSNDYVNLTTGLLSGSYTKEAWVLSRDGSCRNVLSGSGSSTFWFFSNGLRSGNNGANDVIDPTPFVLNTWTHIAATYDSSSGRMTIYKNGVSVDSQLGATDPTDVVLRIGAHGSGCTFDGMIDEVRIWDHARTQGEIQASMTTLLTGSESGLTAYYQFEDGTNSSTLTDVSGNGNNGTLTNMSTATAWVSSGANLTAPSCASAPWSAASEAELNTAIDCFNNETTPGSHAINLTADIDLTASTTQINNPTAGVDLIIDGAGFAIDGQDISGVRTMIIAANTTVKLQNITIKGANATIDHGGGIRNSGSLTIDQTIISGNSGRNGGGIYSTGAMTITNSTIQDNTAAYTGSGSGGGGALVHQTALPIYVANTTITRNTTGYQNNEVVRLNFTTGVFDHVTIAGNFDRGIRPFSSSLTLSNSILNNSLGDCFSDTPTSGGYNISSDASCSLSGTGDLQNTNPQLGSLQNNGGFGLTLQPNTGSPAIDMIPNGTNSCGSALLTDQAGTVRPFNSSCDVGSIEVVPQYAVSVTKSGSGSGTVTSSPVGINCGATCSQDFTVGTTLDLTATADVNSVFLGWTGAITNTSSAINFNVSAATPLTASFLDCGPSVWNVNSEADLNSAIDCFNFQTTPGTYTITLAGDIALTASTTQISNATAGVDLVINGAGFEIDGQTTSGIRPLDVASNTVVKLQNLTVTRGNASGNGGAILSAGSLTIDQSVLSYNVGKRGGAIYSNGPLTITNSTLQNNTADYTGSGSGIGGALEHNSNPIYMANSTATQNTSDYQNNSVVRLNSATGTFIHVTIHGNYDRGFGGYQSTSNFSNSLITNNGSGNCEYNTPVSGGYNISSDTTCALSGTGDLQSTNPLLGSLQDNGGAGLTYKPAVGSPAIGMIPNGTNGCGSAFLVDQAGVSRPNETGCEPGAIEFTFPPPIAVDNDYTMNAGTLLSSNVITANTGSGVDSNPSGKPVKAILVSNVPTGTLNLNEDGAFTYLAPAGYDGAITFTYKTAEQTISTGVFTDTSQSLGSANSRDVELADLDGDGDLDAFVVNQTGADAVWFNDGNGTFTDSGQSLGTGGGEADVALGDLDGDGDIDAFVVDNTNRYWINNGSGTFAAGVQNLSGNSYSVDIADLDGDGDLDVYLGQRTSVDRTLINNGSGTFTNVPTSAGGTDNRGVALADLDGDGDIDAINASCSCFPAQDRVHINNGSGGFANGQTITSGNHVGVDIGDIDGDGDNDVVFARGRGNGANGVYKNNGSANFTLSQSLGNSNTNEVVFGDIDGDGDLDLVAANEGQANTVWTNDGTGAFTDTGQSLGNGNTSKVAVGDLDGDGDLDLFITNNGANQVWLNPTLIPGAQSNVATVTITINGNQPPTAGNDVVNINEDDGSTDISADLLLNDSDPDTDPLLFTSVDATGTTGTVTRVSSTQVTYDPNGQFETLSAGQTLTDTFSYTINDGNGESATATVAVIITGDNDNPTADADSFSVTEDSTGNLLDVLVGDADIDTLDTLSISAVGATDQGGSATISGGTQISYSPAADFAGTETFTYTVGDGNGGSAVATVTVTVNNENDDPTANPDSSSVNEDSTGNLIAVLNNDSILPDTGETLTISAVGTPDQGGSATISGGTQISYSPATNFSGSETFTYTVNDGNGGSATALVSVLVSNDNDNPTANPDSETVDEDSTGNLIAVLANDSILPDVGETLTISTVGTPNQGGSATISGGTQISYSPPADFVGVETFSYTIGDGNGGTASSTVTIQVDNVNDDPVANPDSATVDEDSTGNAISVLTNDSILPDVGETLTISAVGTPNQGGSATVSGGTQIIYAPAANFIGIETVTYTIGDGNGGSATGTVTIQVDNLNDDPTANPDPITVQEDSVGNVLNVLANDSALPDPGETLTILAVGTTDQGGTVVNNGTDISYTPVADFFGTETFTYTIGDGNGGSATATVTLDVQNQNDPPVVASDTFSVIEDATTTNLDVLQNDSTLPDVGETLTIIAVGDTDQNGAVSINGGVALNYQPEPDFFGTETFTYTVNDGNGGQATATVTITISPTNDDPDALDDNYAIAGTDLNVNLDVLTNDTADPDTGETLSIVAVGLPSEGGTATQNGNNIVYTPLAGFTGTDVFTYTIGDGNSGFDMANVYVAVDDDRPNLAISAISFDSNLVCQGEEILVQFSVQNPGVGDAAAFAIAMYDDTAEEGFDNKIGEFNMPSFPSGTNFNFNVTYVPRNLGERHIKFFADFNDVVAESVENNNGASKVLTVLEDPAPTGSISINGGAAFTNNPSVTLGLFGSDSGNCATSVAEMRFFVNGQATAWAPFGSSKSIDFAAADGEKITIYMQLRDENRNTSTWIGESITYDILPPESSVTGPTGTTTKTVFDVSWNGTDLTSDVATYDIQVQDNGGPWTDWKIGTESAVTPYENGEVGHTYCFRSMATDTAGNVELPPVGNGDTCISVIEPITGADISIARLEFNQGIQNDSNSVPLVADRPILVRLEVGLSDEVGQDGIEDVDAKLYGFRDGQPLEGSPLSSINGPITAKPNPNLQSETDLLHFQLPPSWRTGDIQIYAELDPDNVIDEASETNNRYPVQDFKTLSFNPTADLEITVIPIVWNKDGVIHEVTAAEVASFTDYTLRTFPLADIKIKVHSSLRHEGSEINWLELLQDVNAIRGTELPNPAPHQIYYGLIPFPYTSYSGTAGLGYVPGSASIGFATPRESGGVIAAHELGHNFGRTHVSSSHDRCGIPGRPDANYPYPEGVIEYTGWDFGRDRLIGGGTHDFMSYCADVWISDYTYRSIYSQIKQNPAQSRAAADLRVVLSSEGYLVSGSISDDGSSGQLASAFLLESNDTLLDSRGGDFSLVLVNSDNIEIYSQPFDPIPVTEESLVTGLSNFSYLLPALDGVTGIRLYYQNVLLDEFTAESGAVEDITITSAVPEILTTDTLTLTWTDSSESAQYMVRFSADGGATWSLLAPAQGEKSVVVDVTTLPGTTNGLFEVVANDGLANKAVQSNAFTIAEQAPDVVIFNSDEPVMLTNTRSQLILNGNGFDLEDGALNSNQFTWKSNRDGELGTGRLLTVNGLSIGWHTITLEVADSGDNIGQATMQVLVGHTIYLPTILK